MEDMDIVTAAAGFRCELCGSTSFALEGGFYFCQICQTQSQDAREYVEREEFRPGSRDLRSSTLRGAGRGPRSQKALENLSSFEAFNCCLKITTDHIIDMGFPTTLRSKVFSLWTAFLIRRKAILVQASSCRKSANVWHKKRYRSKHKKKVQTRPSATEPDEEDFLSTTIQKRKRTLAQTKAMETSYNFLLGDLISDPPKDTTTSRAIKRRTVQRQKRRRLAQKLTKQSKQVVWALRREGLAKKYYISTLLLQPEIFTMKSLLALVFISLRQIGCKVLMTDVLRMIWSGSIHYSSLRLVLGEESANINAKIDNIFSNSTYNYLSTDYSSCITSLINYIGITKFRYPCFDEFVPKFIDDFNLPRELECLILQMQQVLPVDNQGFDRSHSSFSTDPALPEFHIISTIIVVLRLLFGLDDVTERYQSQFARVVNSLLTSSDIDISTTQGDTEWSQLFVIEDWLSYLRQRRRIIKAELFNPSFYDVSGNYSHEVIDNFVQMYTGCKGVNFARGSEEDKRLETTLMFDEYARLNRPPNHRYPADIPPPETSIPTSCQAHHSWDLNQKLSSSVDNCFTKKRIDFVLNPTKYIKLLKSKGYRVKLLPGDARHYTDSLRNEEESTIIIFQPFKLFDDHMPKHFASTLALKSVVDLLSSVLSGSFDTDISNEKVESLIEYIHYSYSRHLKFGVLNIFPYDLSDTDAQTDSD